MMMEFFDSQRDRIEAFIEAAAMGDLDAIDRLTYNDPAARQAVALACELQPTFLRPKEFSALMDFLQALTDPASLDLRHDVPQQVPSGLPIFD